ncbi:MAG: glucose-6-phosphate dehydrogenase assembly protein OpcA [Sporichthyaceae bacterium]
MSTTLPDTTSQEIERALIAARRAHGGPAAGHVLTLIVVADGHDDSTAVQAACRTAGEHPSRILVVRRHPASKEPRLDAEVFGGGERGPGELVILDLSGELAEHAESVVVPLLLPDTPVVTYWPGDGPSCPATAPMARWSQRRITDLAQASDPMAMLRERAAGYRDGDTDLSWARLTGWRSYLASAFDQRNTRPSVGHVAAEANSPSAELLALWLENRLGIGIERIVSDGPGVTEVRLDFPDGELAISRVDGRLATVRSPDHPERPLALARRDLAVLVSEELRRLDPDEIYAECLAMLCR